MSHEPPRLAERLLTWSLSPDERAAVLGDLAEEFSERTDWTNSSAARRWYWRQALTSIPPNALRRLRHAGGARLAPAWIGTILLWDAWKIRSVPPVSLPIALLGAWSLISVISRLRPSAPPAELFVRAKANGERDPRTSLTISVPNEPLAMSGLVLSRVSARTESSGHCGVRFYDPTIDRAFDRHTSLRVYAAVRTSGALPRVTCDVLDADGNGVRSFSPQVAFNDFERVTSPWDVKPAEDPAPHVGSIDLTLPLADLLPGDYRVRLTTTDGTNAVAREQRITVR